jgi:hypothetical protein
MTLEKQLYDALLADFGVAAFIGDRLYLVQLPQNPVYPAATYQRISTFPLYVHKLGGVQGQVGWSRFQITGWFSGATSGQQSDGFARAVAAAIQTFNAFALPGSPSVLTQAPNYILSRRMHVEPNTQPPIYKAILDVKLWYRDQ